MDSFNKQIFQAGDLAVLYDRRSREYMVQLQESDQFESHIGNLNHAEIIGKPEGSWFPTTTGHLLLAFKPTRFQYTLNMPRVATMCVEVLHLICNTFVIDGGTRITSASRTVGIL